MSTKVVSLGGINALIAGSATNEFQRVLAGHIEGFVEKFGHAPEGLVFVLGDAEGNVVPSWLMRERLEGRSHAEIALASLVLASLVRGI